MTEILYLLRSLNDAHLNRIFNESMIHHIYDLFKSNNVQDAG